MQGFEGENGKNAGHDVQDQSSEKSKKQKIGERGEGSGGVLVLVEVAHRNRDLQGAVSGGVPGIFGHEDSLERGGKWSFFLEGEGEEKFARAESFCLGGLELIEKITFRKKAEGTHLRLRLNDKLEGGSVDFGRGGNMGKGRGKISANIMKESLQIDICFGLRDESQREVRLSRQTGFFANEPLDIYFDRERGGNFFVIGKGESGEEECFLFVAIADEGGGKYFFRKGKLEGARSPSSG